MKKNYFLPILSLLFVMGCDKIRSSQIHGDMNASSLVIPPQQQMEEQEEFLDYMLSDEEEPRYTISNPLILLTGVSDYGSHSKNLPGVKEDLKLFYQLFNNFFGYEVRSTHLAFKPNCRHRLKAKELKSFIWKSTPKTSRNGYDAVFFIFSGHGSRGVIYGSDNKYITFDEIEDRLKYSFLGLPKIYLKLACDGSKLPQTKMESDLVGKTLFGVNNSHNLDAESYTICASPRGQVSFDRQKGCLPAQLFCKLFKDPKYRTRVDFQSFIRHLRKQVGTKNLKELMSEYCTLNNLIFFQKRYSHFKPGLNLLSYCPKQGCSIQYQSQWLNKGLGIFYMDHEFRKNKCAVCEATLKEVTDVVLYHCKYIIEGDKFLENKELPNEYLEKRDTKLHHSKGQLFLTKFWECLKVDVTSFNQENIDSIQMSPINPTNKPSFIKPTIELNDCIDPPIISTEPIISIAPVKPFIELNNSTDPPKPPTEPTISIAPVKPPIEQNSSISLHKPHAE